MQTVSPTPGAAALYLSGSGAVCPADADAASGGAPRVTMAGLRAALAEAAVALQSADPRRADVLLRSIGALPTLLADFAPGIIRALQLQATGLVVEVHPDVHRIAIARSQELAVAHVRVPGDAARA